MANEPFRLVNEDRVRTLLIYPGVRQYLQPSHILHRQVFPQVPHRSMSGPTPALDRGPTSRLGSGLQMQELSAKRPGMMVSKVPNGAFDTIDTSVVARVGLKLRHFDLNSSTINPSLGQGGEALVQTVSLEWTPFRS